MEYTTSGRLRDVGDVAAGGDAAGEGRDLQSRPAPWAPPSRRQPEIHLHLARAHHEQPAEDAVGPCAGQASAAAPPAPSATPRDLRGYGRGVCPRREERPTASPRRATTRGPWHLGRCCTSRPASRRPRISRAAAALGGRRQVRDDAGRPRHLGVRRGEARHGLVCVEPRRVGHHEDPRLPPAPGLLTGRRPALTERRPVGGDRRPRRRRAGVRSATSARSRAPPSRSSSAVSSSARAVARGARLVMPIPRRRNASRSASVMPAAWSTGCVRIPACRSAG